MFSLSDAKEVWKVKSRNHRCSDVKGPPLGLARQKGGQTCRHDGGGFCAHNKLIIEGGIIPQQGC